MSGTHVFYNGILLRDCKTNDFSQLIEYDESGTDPRFNRFRISVEAELTAASLLSAQVPYEPLSTISVPNTPGLTLVDRIAELRRRLSEPRKDFWFALNATTSKPLALQSGNPAVPSDSYAFSDSYRIVLAATGLESNLKVSGLVAGPQGTSTTVVRDKVIDADNGPKPIAVEITQIKGGQAVRVAFTIDICRWFCTPPVTSTGAPVVGAKKGVGVISNRWSIEETVDENWCTSFVIDGTLVVSDLRYKPASMRYLASTALIPYAKLIDFKHGTSSDGLTYKYRFLMKEEGEAPPPGVLDWSGRYTERTMNSGHTTGEVQVKVRGTHALPDGVTRKDQKLMLRDWCQKIISSRLTLSGQAASKLPGQNPKTAVVLDAVYIEDMKEPVVEARATVKHADESLGPDLELRLLNFGNPICDLPQYDPRWWPLPPAYPWDVRSMATVKGHLGDAHNMYFQTPCSEWHGKPEGLVEGIPEEPEEEEASEEASPGSTSEPNVTKAMQLYVFDAKSEAPALAIVSPKDPGNRSPTPLAFSEDQLKSGFTYLQIEGDTVYSSGTGMVALPLSKPRNGQSMTTIRLHSGVQKRVYTMVSSREGQWPQVPEPQAVVTRPAPTSGIGPLVETLTDKDVALDIPKLSSDGTTMVYSVQIRWEYALSRAPDQLGDDLQVGSDPMDNTLPRDNKLPIAYFYEVTGKFYERG